ncbi:MAG TPA: ATP-dependent DNA helicase RecG, partial [Trinickia sp.]|nr:ATP-dependent DNA helicase RecG [Trinickia sp.]
MPLSRPRSPGLAEHAANPVVDATGADARASKLAAPPAADEGKAETTTLGPSRPVSKPTAKSKSKSVSDSGSKRAMTHAQSDSDAPAPEATQEGDSVPAAESASRRTAASSKTANKLAKLGLTRDIDLVLHLPMRYEDETTLTPIGELLPGETAQTEGVVVDNEIAYRPRRQLVV